MKIKGVGNSLLQKDSVNTTQGATPETGTEESEETRKERVANAAYKRLASKSMT
jgi:hypothetical protein